MELSFSELREKEVINISDGRSLGRVNDIVFSYPEGIVYGIVVPGRRGWRLFKWRCNDIFIDFHHIKKMGDDVVLVDLHFADRPKRKCYNENIKVCENNDNREGRSKIDLNDYE